MGAEHGEDGVLWFTKGLQFAAEAMAWVGGRKTKARKAKRGCSGNSPSN